MGFIRTLAEYAAAAANLHPEHRPRYEELVTDADRAFRPPSESSDGQPALTTAKFSSSSTSTSSSPASSISTS